MRISDWSSDVCSSDLLGPGKRIGRRLHIARLQRGDARGVLRCHAPRIGRGPGIVAEAHRHARDSLAMPGEKAPRGMPFIRLLAFGELGIAQPVHRSEEGRVGKEWVSMCSYRWYRFH